MKGGPLKRIVRYGWRPVSSALLCVGTFLFLVFGGKFLSVPAPKTDAPSAVPTTFTVLSLAARTVFVLDAKTGTEIWSLNPDTQLPLASLTKIMMAVTALSLAPASTTVTIDSRFLQSEGDSGLFGSERWRLDDLVDLTLVESSNDGASAIAAVVGAGGQGSAFYGLGQAQFVNAMNKKADELGLAQTYFLNPTGLDMSADVSGSYGSARDVATLFSYALRAYPKLFGATRYPSREFTSLSALKHTVKNTDTLVDRIPALLGSKTGYTDLAGGNLVIAFAAGPERPIVISVLGSTEQGRFDDVEKLVWAALSYLANHDL